MQTFLPYPSFEESAQALDDKRLGKQRVEAIQVVRGLVVPGYGWRHHPAVKMWAGHLEALGRYGLTCCEVWIARGYVPVDVRGGPSATSRRTAALTSVHNRPAQSGYPQIRRPR